MLKEAGPNRVKRKLCPENMRKRSSWPFEKDNRKANHNLYKTFDTFARLPVRSPSDSSWDLCSTGTYMALYLTLTYCATS